MISVKDKIFVAGHNGLVGRAIVRRLKKDGYKNILTAERKQLDLVDQKKVFKFLKTEKPKFIFLAAAKVGGIYSNTKYKAEYIYQNISIQSNIIHGAYLAGVKDLIFLGSSCVYPRASKQPMKENYLLNGYLEETNDAYAIAKILGIKMCESYNKQYNTNYKTLLPSNIFGPNDNYHELNSHFLAALIKKIHLIKKKELGKLILWGNGMAKRELLYVDDMADACIYFMKKQFKESYINIGTGKDLTIEQYAKKILKIILPRNQIKISFDTTKPNGMPRKILDIKLASKYGWKAKTNIDMAIKKTYISFLSEKSLNK